MATATSRDGTRIGFEQAGTGPTLVLVDAAGGFRGFGPMGSLAGHLADRFTVVTYDRRGRGESGDTPPYAVEREVEDLAAVIGAAGGPAFVHGFSSGAVLALLGAAAGLPISMLSLLEPPIMLDGPSPEAGEGDLAAEIEELVAAGRRADAVEHFNRSIGVPEEMIAEMRQAPFFPMLEGIAHTLAYDSRITPAVSRATLQSVTVPALVVNSDSSDDRLRGWAGDVAAALPQGRHLELKGDWHGVPDDVLASALAGFFDGGAA
ncbi:alpha/beta hydrolase [Planobispora rosea]|uniref:Alpha/beta hydrolase n=1 Tax=Planobispora rosea TaxID=35762 RepID=A0A8J3SCT2_PLARO|nr:alpha/beta fold hydrolase [Planobispora rosea]GGS94001.1 alpha/beta hydrolase [Planobispora rosea]GIH87373.1 alpha/beta hydrolase [Planobispora rosea]